MSNTQALWKVRAITKFTVETLDGALVCELDGEGGDEYMAEAQLTAHLIAAAPMLKYYLKQLHGDCDRTCCDVCVTIQRAEGRS